MLNVPRNESTYCFQDSVYNNNHVLLKCARRKSARETNEIQEPSIILCVRDVVFFVIMSSRDKQSVTPFETKRQN